MSNLPKGDRNRLEGMGENALRAKLEQIENLQDRRARKAQEDARRFIVELLAKKEQQSTQPEQKTPEQEERQRLKAIRQMWEKPFNRLLDIVREQPAPTPERSFPHHGHVSKTAGEFALLALGTRDVSLEWVNDIAHSTDRRKVAVIPTMPSDDSRFGINEEKYVRASDGHTIHAVAIDDMPMTPEFAAIRMAEAAVVTSKRNGILTMTLGRTKDVGEFEITEDHLRMGITLQAADLLSKGGVRRAAIEAQKQFNIQSVDDLNLITSNPPRFLALTKAITRSVTRRPAASPVDLSVRSYVALHAMVEILPAKENFIVDMQQQWYPLFPLNQVDPEWSEVETVLTEMHADPKDFSFAFSNEKGPLFLARRDAVPEDSPLLQYEHPDYEDTLDLAVALDQETDESANAQRDERHWISGKLPTKEELRVREVREEIAREGARLEMLLEHNGAGEESHRGVAALALKRLRSMPWKNAPFGSSEPNIEMINAPGGAHERYIGQRTEQDAMLSLFVGKTYGQANIVGGVISRTVIADGRKRIHEIGLSSESWTPQMRVLKLLSTDSFWNSAALNKVWTVDDIPPTFKQSNTVTMGEIVRRCLYPQFAFDASDDASLLKNDPQTLLSNIHAMMRTITRRRSLSESESMERILWALRDKPSDPQGFQNYYNAIASDLDNAVRLDLETRPRAIVRGDDPSIDEAREILSLSDETATVAQMGSRRLFVCRKEHLPESMHSYLSADTEETLDLVVNLDLQDEASLETDAWVSGTLPSIEQLEAELFEQLVVADKFFPDAHGENDRTVPDDEPESTLPESDPTKKSDEPLPRLKALRNTLLKNRWKAQFTIDDRHMAPAKPTYAEAEPGHYVLVSLPEAKLQVLISDDRSKGTYVIRNLIDPAEFTTISIDEFLAKYGATRVKFDSIPQFRGALETEIGEQIKDPITIYPVASSFKTPLHGTRFPNPEAVSLLRRDFEMAARIAGKASIEDLTVGDFANIESGPARWSFGGVAGGASYLDRLATELGLDASDMPVSRERVLENIDSIAANTEHGTPPATPENAARWKETVLQPIKQYDFRQRALDLLLSELSDAHLAKKSDEPAGLAEHRRETKRMRRKNGNGKQHPEESAAQ